MNEKPKFPDAEFVDGIEEGCSCTRAFVLGYMSGTFVLWILIELGMRLI